MKSPYAAAVFAVLATGCVSTRIEGEVVTRQDDPLASLVVYCDVRLPELRREVESRLSGVLISDFCDVARSIDLLPEPRKYTDSEARALFAAGGHDAVVRLHFTDFGSNDVVQRPAWFEYHDDDNRAVEVFGARGRPRFHAVLDIVRVGDGVTLWRGRARSSGPSDLRLPDLAESLGNRLRYHLERHDLIIADG